MSSPEHEEPELDQQPPNHWQRFRQCLGFRAVAANGQGEQDAMTTAVEADLRDENGNFSPKKIAAAIERKEQERLDRLSPPGYPMPLEAGPQRYDTPPSFWRPDTGGVPLAEDDDYQWASKLVDKLARKNAPEYQE